MGTSRDLELELGRLAPRAQLVRAIARGIDGIRRDRANLKLILIICVERKFSVFDTSSLRVALAFFIVVSFNFAERVDSNRVCRKNERKRALLVASRHFGTVVMRKD